MTVPLWILFTLAGIFGFFVPRMVLAIVGGCILGGWWWVLFLPLAIGGFVIDVLIGKNVTK